MEDYRLEQSGQEVQDILNGAAMQVDLNSEVERATEAENILDGKIDAEEERAKVAEKANADDIDAIEEKIPSGASSSNKLATASDVNDEAQARSDADQTINGKIDAIDAKIPSGASSENKLATEEYVDDSVATNTATFRGTYNLVSDLGLLPSATHEQIAYALGGEIATADNSDYAFVQIPTSAETPTQIAKIERYKFNGNAWAFEYDLNNSGFTAAQWSAINSGITSGDVTKLSALPTNAELTTLLNGKQDTLTFDNTPTENSKNPVKSGGVYSAIKDEETRAKAAEKANADDIDAIEEKIPSGATSSNKLATESDVTGEATTRENADAALQQAIEAILLLIPSAATSLNQLADKAFVNSSIATNTATFRGTFNSVSDLHLSISATHEQIGTMLASSIVTADNNDYAFVQIPTSAHRPTEIARTERYKFNGTTWEYEYDLNNSGYTTAQWAAINSTITQELVTKLSALPNNDDLTTALSVLTDSISAINAKIPSSASSDNKLVDTTEMQTYIAQLLDVLDATYNVTSTDGHVTVQITQTNGKVTAFTVTTSDIASAADLELIAGRITTAEGNISTNAEDIAQLQAAYAALTQNDIVIIQPTDTWPVANPAENIIYRVVDRVNTPPEYYSDYMWNGTTMVLMAQYNNAIDPRPKKGSTNLVESGGVFDNIGALDVSELNATENPHTLATYADLSTAIAAIPSDYQKGGMSIKFVQSSDNKYVQARCMSQNFTTDVTQWQAVDDEPIAGSNNLVKSGGVFPFAQALGDMIVEKTLSDDVDLDIADTEGKAIAKFKGGHIETKNFKSKTMPIVDGTSIDLNITDVNNYSVLKIKNGHIKTKNFDSEKQQIQDSHFDYEVGDEEGNIVLRVRNGHIKTKKFSSENVGDNPLFGKTIVWYGTSIPASGYPEICGSYLNATVHNEAVGGSCCRMGYIGAVVDPDDPRGDKYGITGINWTTPCTSLSMKQEEKHDLFVNWTTARRKANLKAQYGYTDEEVANVKGWGELLTNNPPADIMDSAYDNYRKMSYGLSYNTYTNVEAGLGTILGKVDKYLNENNFPDLWVFDHGHNDNSPEIETVPTPDNDRRYFIGAMNYIIEHILEYNPRARFVFIGHYENDDAGGSWDHSKLCEAQKILADYWNTSLYESWKMFNLSRSRVITTNAYWDANDVWHQSGFDGTNAKAGTATNPRQIDGIWVHDMSLTQVHMLDGLHPHQQEIKEFMGHSIAKFMSSLIVTF